MSESAYLLNCVRGHPVIATPTDRRLRRAAIRRFQATSPRRRLVRTALLTSTLLRLDRLIARRVSTPPLDLPRFDFDAWLNEMRSTLGAPRAQAAVVWPPQRSRKRVYVHLLDGNDSIGFAKLALDRDESARLLREAGVLRAARTWNLTHTRVPGVILCTPVGVDGTLTLLTEPLPADARPLRPDQHELCERSRVEIAGPIRQLESRELENKPWWIRFWHANQEPQSPFAAALRHAARRGLRVCRVHGDYGLANMALSGEDLWTFDWEASESDAPARTDEVGLFIGPMIRQTLANPDLTMSALRDRFWVPGATADKDDLVCAIAYRHSHGFEDASLLIDCWHNVEE